MYSEATFSVIGFIAKTEVKTLAGDKKIAIISIANNINGKEDKETKTRETRSNFTQMTIWDKFIISGIERGFIVKGKYVMARGCFEHKQYEKDGIKKYTTEFIAKSIDIMERKAD